MLKLALVLALLTGFLCGMMIQDARWEIATVDWIDPSMVTVAPNPFGNPSPEQQAILDAFEWHQWQQFGQLTETDQDAAEANQI